MMRRTCTCFNNYDVYSDKLPVVRYPICLHLPRVISWHLSEQLLMNKLIAAISTLSLIKKLTKLFGTTLLL